MSELISDCWSECLEYIFIAKTQVTVVVSLIADNQKKMQGVHIKVVSPYVNYYISRHFVLPCTQATFKSPSLLGLKDLLLVMIRKFA